MYIVKNKMPKKFHLIAQTQDGVYHQILYQLANTPMAGEWIKKIKHISKIPLDTTYTNKNDPTITKESLNSNIAKDIESLNNIIGKIYDVKSEYTQQDCNYLHSFTIKHQYNQTLETRNIIHRLHRQLHLLEDRFNVEYKQQWILADWGEAGGPLTSIHKQSPYDDYYDLNMAAGNIYHCWAEFGKTPYSYWKDQDVDDIDHFINNCKPHMTFRPGFGLCIDDHVGKSYDAKFEKWFKKYQSIWEETYNAPPISPYSMGGILLAKPLDQFDFSNIYTLTAIKLID